MSSRRQASTELKVADVLPVLRDYFKHSKSRVFPTEWDERNIFAKKVYNEMYNLSINNSNAVTWASLARWGVRKIDRNDRKCDQCDDIEDEYHCLLICPKFVKERKGCLPDSLLKRQVCLN